MNAPSRTSPGLDSEGPLLVLGAGRSGLALARFLSQQGAQVILSDRHLAADLAPVAAALPRGVELRAGEQTPSLIEGCAAVYASPGVAWDSPILAAARAAGLPVSSEIDLFFRHCRAPIVGITGTNGKTTTTALVGDVLTATGRPIMVGGNIGETVLDRLDEVTPDHLVVLELSSFQLESVADPRMAVAAILNISPDHLDRHHSFDAYVNAKARAIEFLPSEGHAVLNGEDDVCRGLAPRTRGQLVWFDRHLPRPMTRLPGRHNLLNALAAASIGRVMGLDDEQIQAAIAAFAGVEHRLELVGEWAGVRWYNDSKATNPEAGEVALEAFPAEPVILIAGGQGDFQLDRWLRVVADRAESVLVIGADPKPLADRLRHHPGLQVAGDLATAVEMAGTMARPGSVVLFSPAFKSFDQFANFEARGRRFKDLVQQWEARR